MSPPATRPFAQVPRDARGVLRDLPDTDVKVLLMLLLVKRQGEDIRAGHEMLEDITGVSMRSLRDVLPRLVAAGLITYTAGAALGRGRGRAPCRIRVLDLPEMVDHAPVQSEDNRATEIAAANNAPAKNGSTTAIHRLSNGSLTADIQETGRLETGEEEKQVASAPSLTKGFRKPTVEEVRAYCLERGNHIDAERFVDHYTAKGWVVGKAPMKDWQAAIRNWEQRDGTPRPVGAQQIASLPTYAPPADLPDYLPAGTKP